MSSSSPMWARARRRRKFPLGMSWLAIAFAVWAALTTLAGLVMALARTPPDVAISSLSEWAKKARLYGISQWLKDSATNEAFFRWSARVFALMSGVAIGFYFGAVWSPFVVANPKSPLLRIDDAKRFQLIKALSDGVANQTGRRYRCHATIQVKPDAVWAHEMSSEIVQIMTYSGWLVEGGTVQTAFFPAGITLITDQKDGGAFTCAFILSEMLRELGVRTRQENKTTPDLAACHNNAHSDCVGILFGGEH